jgi:very-short-patch-repair endonuclease
MSNASAPIAPAVRPAASTSPADSTSLEGSTSPADSTSLEGSTSPAAPPDPAGPASPSSVRIAHAPSIREVCGESTSPSADLAARAVSVLGVSRKIIVSGSRDARIAAIAERQRGRVNRRQLLAAGLSKGQIHHLARTDRLFRRHAGVYAVGHPGDVPLGGETAALLAAREGAVLSHASAAALWGIDAVQADPDLVHILVEADAGTRRAGIRTHRSRTLRPVDRRVRMNLPVCSAARMLLDLAAELDDRSLERAFDQALVLGVVSDREIADLVTCAGGHGGRRALHDLVSDHISTTVTRSEAEERLLALVRTADLPEPGVNVRLCGYEVDFLWAQSTLAVEVDGYRFHSSRGAFERDRIRDARLQAAGIEVLRVTWRRLELDPFAVIAEIAGALARRTPRYAIDASSGAGR